MHSRQQKRILINTFFLITSKLLIAQVETNFDSTLVGNYQIEGFNMAADLDLRHNHTFSHKVSFWSCLGGGETKEFVGEYYIRKNQIFFKPTYYVKSEYFNKQLSKKDSVEYNSSKHLFRDSLIIIRWQNHIYLLGIENLSLLGFYSQNDFTTFVDNIKSGNYTHLNDNLYWQKELKSIEKEK